MQQRERKRERGREREAITSINSQSSPLNGLLLPRMVSRGDDHRLNAYSRTHFFFFVIYNGYATHLKATKEGKILTKI